VHVPGLSPVESLRSAWRCRGVQNIAMFSSVLTPSPQAARPMRSLSMGALEARRRRLAFEIRLLQEDATSLVHKAEMAELTNKAFGPPPPADHYQLLTRAWDLDRLTAGAISMTQDLHDASNMKRHQRARGLSVSGSTTGAFASGRSLTTGFPHTDWSNSYSLWEQRSPRNLTRIAQRSKLDFTTSDLSLPFPQRVSWAAAPPAFSVSPKAGSPFDSPSSQGYPWGGSQGLDVTASFGGTPRRSLSPRKSPGSPASPPRPAIYSSSTPRRPSRQSRLSSPYRPVLPSRAEVGYVADTPQRHGHRKITLFGDRSSVQMLSFETPASAEW